MKGYRVDFTMNQGHVMLIDREDGINRDELDELELRMLESAQPSYLLPLSWQELNGAVTFSYGLSGCKMLQHQLQQQRMTMEQYYGLILGLIDALDECRHHMLRPEGCLLDDQYIFTTGEQLQRIRLTYMPMKDRNEGLNTGPSELMTLIVRWTAYVDQLDGEGLKQILALLNEKRWPLAELRELLLGLICQKPCDLVQHTAGMQSVRQSFSRESAKGISDGIHKSAPSADWQGSTSLHWDDDKTILSGIDSDQDLDNELDEADDSKRRWLTAAVSTVVMACIWRFVYFKEASTQTLLISLALTLIVFGCLLLLWRKWSDGLAANVEARFAGAEFVPDSSLLSKTGIARQEAAEPHRAAYAVPSARDAENKQTGLKSMLAMNEADLLHAIFEPAPVPKQPADQRSVSESERLPPTAAPLRPLAAEPTVMLGKEAAASRARAEIWLTRSCQGSEERIKVEGESLKIGRAEDQNGYVDQANGVSRLHLAFERWSGQSEGEYSYAAKDLGSRNGSYLNGQLMIPYKLYPLTPNDTIHLASLNGPSYTYSMSRSAW